MSAARPLSRDRILRSAFALADKKGLEAVTMRSVAAKLGVEAMSLYHHVPSKKAMLEGLLDLLVEVAELPAGDVASEDWIRGASAALRTLAQKHPRLVPLLTSRTVPLADPAAARPFEAGLAAFTRQGLPVPQAFAAVQSVALALLSMTQLEATAALHPQDDGEESGIAALPPEDFPLLHEVASTGPSLDDFWQTLTDGLVRGLA